MSCPRTDCTNEAIQDPQFGVLPCLDCRAKDTRNSEAVRHQRVEFYTISQQDRFQKQRDEAAKDILQPFIGDKPNPEFVKAYPQYRDQYFTKEQLKSI